MLLSPLLVGDLITRELIRIQFTGSRGEILNLSEAEDRYKALDSDSEGAYIHSKM